METRLTVKTLQYQSWLAMVQQQVKSGLPVRKWCGQNGISPKTFYFRRKRVREELLQAAAPTFAELSAPTQEAPAPGHGDGFTTALTITLNGMVIGVGRDTSAELLSDILRVVRNA